MSTEQPLTSLPKNFIRPCLLLLLREQPAHGYDLVERLRAFGFSRDDPGRLYRALRALEDEGFVHSAWEKSQAGPDRRIYELTRAGGEVLHEEVKAVAQLSETLQAFLGRYEEFVAVSHRGVKTGRR